MKQISLLLVISLLTIVSFAQNEVNLDGKYIGKFEKGGFQDSIIIQGDSFCHILNEGWGYGVEHQYIYKIISLENDLIQFKQIGYLRDRINGVKLMNKGRMHMQQTRIVKLSNGDIQFVSPSHPNNPQTFGLIID